MVWNAARAKKRLIIASDGSLTDTAGTFGWKLTTNKHLALFKGSGPVDGPIELGSSTRSEIGGFTAPLLLVTVLARFWKLKHSCSFRWLADNQVAINRITLVTRPDYAPTKQPDNCDYLSLIRDLFKELRQPLQAQWIKSHQDFSSPYEKLSADTKLNIEVDKLATAFHKKPKAQSMRDTAHIPSAAPSTKISVQIQSTRYDVNLDDNIRYHVNSGYMKTYLQTRHSWSESVWKM
jgi:hypothetical protein